MRLCSSILVGIILFISCSEIRKENPKEKDIFGIAASGKSLFRGVSMGDKVDFVLSKETGQVNFKSDSLLELSSNIVMNNEEVSMRLFYSFDEYGLFEIQADIFLSEKGTENLKKRLTRKLTGRYGDPKEFVDYVAWSTFNQSNDLIEITLSDDVDLNGISFLSLNFLEPLNDKI